MIKTAFYGVLFSFLVSNFVETKVLELSDRFLPLRHEGMWLISFYAPWCGHCKKLEPIWKHVDQSLAGKMPIRVGRIDCTRFTSVATEFSIKGFPTILFLKGESVYQYEGDRTRDDIVNFALRLVGPSVNQIESKEDFEDAKSKAELFFAFAGERAGREWENFEKIATNLQQHERFYQIDAELAQDFSGQRETQSIRVYKDSSSFKFEENSEIAEERAERDLSNDDTELVSENITESLHHWVLRERFPRFVKVTRGRFSQLMSTKKLLVMAVLEENKLGEITPDMEAFRTMLHSVMENHIDRYRPHYQFGWTGSPDLANSVAMDALSIPHLMVINTTSYQHYLPDDEPTRMTPEAVTLYLDSILDGDAPVYGGFSYTVRLYRAFYEAKTNIFEMWKGNPALTSVLFGLPMGFFALICYSICCADIMDADEEDEDELNYSHEKTD